RLGEGGDVPTTGGEALRTGVQVDPGDPVPPDQTADDRPGFQQHHVRSGAGGGAGGHQTGHPTADHGQVEVHCSCSQPVDRKSTSGSVSGGTPWPRLTTCAGAARPAVSTCWACSRSNGQSAASIAGSLFPCSSTHGT